MLGFLAPLLFGKGEFFCGLCDALHHNLMRIQGEFLRKNQDILRFFSISKGFGVEKLCDVLVHRHPAGNMANYSRRTRSIAADGPVCGERRKGRR